MADLVTAGTVDVYQTGDVQQGAAGSSVTVFDVVYRDGAYIRPLSATTPLPENHEVGLALTSANAGQIFEYARWWYIDFNDRNPEGTVWVASHNAGCLMPFGDLNANDYVHVIGTSWWSYGATSSSPGTNRFSHKGQAITGVRLASTSVSGNLAIDASNLVEQAGATVGEYVVAGGATREAGDAIGPFGLSINATRNRSTLDGIALNTASSGQACRFCRSGPLSVGPILSKGQIYVVSSTAGKIMPIADLGSGEYLTVAGWAKNNSTLVVNVAETKSALV